MTRKCTDTVNLPLGSERTRRAAAWREWIPSARSVAGWILAGMIGGLTVSSLQQGFTHHSPGTTTNHHERTTDHE